LDRSEGLSIRSAVSKAIAALLAELGARLYSGSAATAIVDLLRGLLIWLLIRLLIWWTRVAVIARSILRALLILHEEIDKCRRPAND